MMNIITMEEHYASPRVMSEIAKYAKTKEASQKFVQVEGLDEAAERRLKFMDENGVKTQILSYVNTIPEDLPAEVAVEICRMANDDMAEITKKYPGRFEGFVTLPLQDIQASVEELERAVKSLGLRGIMLVSRFQGEFYSKKKFFPIFEKAAELGVPVYIHPAFIDSEIKKRYYDDEKINEITSFTWASAGFGWHLDAGMSVMHLILSGLFDRLPDLQVITGHNGEVVLYYMERMSTMLSPERTALKKNISDYFRSNIYISNSGMLSEDMTDFVIKQIGIDRVMFSLDYPYIPLKNADKFIQNLSISQEDKDKIAFGNAKKLFGL